MSALQSVLPLHISNLLDGSHVERAAGTIAAFSVGLVTRRLGCGPVLIWSLPLLIAACLGLWLMQSYVMLLAMLAVVGVIEGLAVTSLRALIALRAPGDSAGATFGVVSSINSFAFSDAPFIAGVIASAFGLRAVFPFSALLAVGMLVLCLRVTPHEPRACSEPATAAAPPQKSPTR